MGTPTLTRPLKVGNVHTYVEEVNSLAPADAPILAPEVDADLDTLYSAWNNPASAFPPTGAAGGDLAGSSFPAPVVAPGAITTAKLADGAALRVKIGADAWLSPIPTGADVGKVLGVAAGPALAWQTPPGASGPASGDLQGSYPAPTIKPSALPWTPSGATLTPTDPTKAVVLAPIQIPLQLGATAIKHTFVDTATAGLQIQTNYGATINDTSKPQWAFAMSAPADVVAIYRSPAGTTPTWSTKFQLGGNGILYLPGSSDTSDQSSLLFGSRTQKGRVMALAGLDWVGLTKNQRYTGTAWVRDDGAQPAWSLEFSHLDQLSIDRNGLGLVTVDAVGVITSASVRCTGSTAGVRFQNVGTMGGDGYSNGIAFGYTGAIPVRVDGTQMGTMNITPPSDIRYKLDVQQNVPGLAAVLALRPVTFTYDQTKREIGFPVGRHYGLIAQEAREHVPLVIEDDGTDQHFLGLDYRLLVPVLIRAVQELAARMTALEARGA